MVIEPYNSRPATVLAKSDQGQMPLLNRAKMAAPMDRLAAASVDWLVVLVPIFVALSAPFKRHMLESMVLDDRSEFVLTVTALALIALIGSWLYQSLMTYFWGGSAGKLLFGLRVVDVWTHRAPRLGACMIRGGGYILGTLLFCVPHLSIFSNVRRRPLHDKLADTMVISLRRPAVGAPHSAEASFVRGIYAGFLAIVLLVMGIAGGQITREIRDQEQLATILGEEDEVAPDLCEAVTDAMERAPGGRINDGESRLQTALAMFAAGTVGRECLRLEVDEVLHRQGEESALAYVAQAFVHADQAELSNAYLEQACKVEPDSESCHLTSLISSWASSEAEGVDQALDAIADEPSLFVKIWRVRYLMKLGRYQDALTALNSMGSQPAVASFMGVLKVKAMWGENHLGEARLLGSTLIDSLDPDMQTELAGWMCYEELNLSCRARASSGCQVIEKQMAEREDLLETPIAALAVLQLKDQCGKGSAHDFNELITEDTSSAMQTLVEAYQSRASGQRVAARESLRKLWANEKTPDTIKDEALRRYVSWSTSHDELTSAQELWKQATGRQRLNAGQDLIRRHLALGDYKQAVELLSVLNSDGETNSTWARELMVAAYKSGQHREAWAWLKKYRDGLDNFGGPRSPASVDDFSQVVMALEKEFQRP